MSDYGGRLIRDTEPTVTSTTASGIWTIEEALKYKKAGTWPTFTTDPNFKQTVLLLYGDGTNGAQNNTFLDSSTNNFTITRNGNTTQGTFSPFSVGAGEWSNYFDGSGDYLSSPNNSAIHVLGSDFCLEGWFYLNTAPANYGLYSTYSDNSTGEVGGYIVRIDSTYFRFFYFADSSGTSVAIDRTYTFSQGQWYHFAVTVSSGTGRIFINGVQQGATFTVSSTQNSTKSLQIGRTHTLTNDFPGYFSNFRVVKGSAVYTSNFTPSTTPLTAIANTSLLTCQSNRFVDNSTNAFAITRNGDVRVTPFSPFAPTTAYDPAVNGGSGYFDGSGDYLSITDNSAFDLGSGDFTIEAWVYPQSLSNNGAILTQWPSLTNNSYIFLYFATTGRPYFAYSTSGGDVGITGTTTSVTLNTWNHIAVTRSGSTIRLFVNGVQDATTGNIGTAVILNSSAEIRISRLNASDGDSYVNGYMSNVRLVKGTAVYTSNFTPPTTPLTAITNTSLLLNFTNAGIIDNTGKNVLETVGNAQIDTTTKKFGTGSLEFDGTGDYILTPSNNDFTIITGDFTLEFWCNLPSYGGNQCLFEIYNDDQNRWNISAVGTLVFFSNVAGTGSVKINATAPSINTWHHIALVKSGSTFTLYINGTSVGTSTTTSYHTTLSKVSIGAGGSGGSPITGYIDDLRITKGVARYTANFTPPTAAFLDQ